MDALSSPVPSAVLAKLKQHYQSAYDVLKKNLENHHAQIIEVQEELISSQSQQIFSFEKQLRIQNERLGNQDAQVRALQDEIAELKGRLARVAESVAGVVAVKGRERMSDYSTQHDRDSGGRMEAVSEQAVSLQGTKDLSLRQDKELPPRPKSAVSSLLNDIDNMIVEIELQPVTNAPPATEVKKDSNSQGELTGGVKKSNNPQGVPMIQRVVALQPPSPSFYNMSSPTYAFVQELRSPTALQTIGEDVGDNSIRNPNNLPFNEFQPIMTERVRSMSPARSMSPTTLPQRTDSILQPQPVSPRITPGTHPLFRPRPRTSSSEYSRASTPPPPAVFPAVIRKETFVEKMKHKQTSFNISKLHKHQKSTDPELVESDSVVRAKIRSEAERRKAANFGPGDKVERNGVIHSMVLLPEIGSGSLGAKPKLGIGVGEPQLDVLRKVVSDGSKEAGRNRGGVRDAMRRWRNDVWKRGSTSKNAGSPHI